VRKQDKVERVKKTKFFNKHHRVPRSRGGNGKAANISMVCRDKHAAYHLLFQNYLPEQVAAILNEVWIDPTKELIVKKRPTKGR